MNLKKEIFERISAIEKVELSEVKKIELGLVEDIATASKNADQIALDLTNATKKADEFNQVIIDAQKQLQTAIANVKKAYSSAEKFQTAEDKIWDKATKAAADLGLSRNDIKGWTDFEQNGIKVNSAINGANKYMA